MNSFNTISYTDGVLTINGTQYNIEASGNSVSGNSFSQVKLENNILTIDGIEITLTEYVIITNYLQDANDNYLLDTNDNRLEQGDGIENANLILTSSGQILNDKYGIPLEFV